MRRSVILRATTSRCWNMSRQAGAARLSVLVVHDDATREYAYGPAQGLPATRVGTLSQAMYDMANKQSWTIISMKREWKRIFAFKQ
jgi:hypothetical protein